MLLSQPPFVASSTLICPHSIVENHFLILAANIRLERQCSAGMPCTESNTFQAASHPMKHILSNIDVFRNRTPQRYLFAAMELHYLYRLRTTIVMAIAFTGG